MRKIYLPTSILLLATSVLAHSEQNGLWDGSMMHSSGHLMGYNMWGMGGFGLFFGLAFWILVGLGIFFLYQKITEERTEG